MPTLSPTPETTSRKNSAAILRRLASVGQVEVAKALGVDESTVSRMKERDIDRFATMLTKLGLKVVNTEYRCVDPKTLETLLHGHRMWVASIESHEQLTWD